MHVALLRARALLRLSEPDEALRALRVAESIPSGIDESISVRMLAGAAHVRRGDVDEGLARLVAAQSDAASAHRTIRSEIALNVGLAHYARRDFTAAERAISKVANDADLVSARAIQYRAWIALGRDHTGRAAALFGAALEALAECRHHDRFFEANCVRALAHLALERFDRDIWALVLVHRARIDWSANGLAQPRYFIAYCAAGYQLDVEGNPLEAAREAREAERIATSDAYRAQARCKRAAIARGAGELLSHRDHVESASELFERCDTGQLVGDEKLVPLVLAEELAYVDPGRARAMYALYGELSPMSPTLSATRSCSAEAYRSVVDAVVFERAGEHHAAVRRYRDAFGVLSSAGYRRRAMLAALSIVRLTGDRKLQNYVTLATAQLAPRSWLQRQAGAATAAPLRLTDVQREVLALICQGKSNPDIAALRKRSLHTIRNLVARLFEIFEVTSREELAVQCVRRGLYTPG